jgi:hypothetical protein
MGKEMNVWGRVWGRSPHFNMNGVSINPDRKYIHYL